MVKFLRALRDPVPVWLMMWLLGIAVALALLPWGTFLDPVKAVEMCAIVVYALTLNPIER